MWSKFVLLVQMLLRIVIFVIKHIFHYVPWYFLHIGPKLVHIFPSTLKKNSFCSFNLVLLLLSSRAVRVKMSFKMILTVRLLLHLCWTFRWDNSFCELLELCNFELLYWSIFTIRIHKSFERTSIFSLITVSISRRILTYYIIYF